MLGVNPSYDFRLFDVGWVSPLQANEFGAATSFRASDPTSFVDFSLNQLAGLLNPRAANPYPQRQLPAPIEEVPFLSYFQSQQGRQVGIDEFRAEAQRRGCTAFDLITGNCKPAIIEGEAMPKDQEITKHDGGDTLATEGSKKVGATLTEWWKALPAGAGVFLIGVAALIFILLFARK